MATEYKVKGLKVLPEYDKIRIVDAYQIQNKDNYYIRFVSLFFYFVSNLPFSFSIAN